jgi:hypothetical protein
MATLKKQRQQKTMLFRRVLGIDIASARKLARHALRDHNHYLTVDDISQLLGSQPYVRSCECCGPTAHIWTTDKGILTDSFGTLTVEQKVVRTQKQISFFSLLSDFE